MKYELVGIEFSKRKASNNAKKWKRDIESRGGKVTYKIKEVPQRQIKRITRPESLYSKRKLYGIYWNIIRDVRD